MADKKEKEVEKLFTNKMKERFWLKLLMENPTNEKPVREAKQRQKLRGRATSLLKNLKLFKKHGVGEGFCMHNKLKD